MLKNHHGRGRSWTARGACLLALSLLPFFPSLTHATQGRQYYLQDALGTTTNLATAAGYIQATYQLGAWGSARKTLGSSVNYRNPVRYVDREGYEATILVPGAGVEPALPCGKGILSPLCLPFHHPGLKDGWRKDSRFSPPPQLAGC